MKSAENASPNLPKIPLTVFPTASTGFSKLLPTDLPTPSKSPSFLFLLSFSSSNVFCFCSSFCSFFSVSTLLLNIFDTFSIFNLTIFFKSVIFLELFETCLARPSSDPDILESSFPNTLLVLIFVFLNISFLSEEDLLILPALGSAPEIDGLNDGFRGMLDATSLFVL